MKSIYIAFSITKDGKNHAYADTIKARENLINFIKPMTKKAVICESATQAAYLAEEWNRTYRNNNTYMF